MILFMLTPSERRFNPWRYTDLYCIYMVTGQFAQGQFARGQFAQKFEFFFLNTNLT